MCRQQVLTVAYLLCGFTDFHKLGAFLRKTLADTAFGAARMEATIQRVVEGTRQWGLTDQEDLALYSVGWSIGVLTWKILRMISCS